MNLSVNSVQDKAIARDTVTFNTNILREHHTITSEGKNYASVNTHKDACLLKSLCLKLVTSF